MKTGILFLFCLCFFHGLFCEAQEIFICSSYDEAVKNRRGPHLLVFFSTSCQVCWEDLLEMKYFLHKQSIDIQLVGVSRDLREDLEKFADMYSIDCPVISDRKGELYKKYQVDLEPFKLLIVNSRVFYRDSYYDTFQEREERIKEVLMRFKSKCA